MWQRESKKEWECGYSLYLHPQWQTLCEKWLCHLVWPCTRPENMIAKLYQDCINNALRLNAMLARTLYYSLCKLISVDIAQTKYSKRHQLHMTTFPIIADIRLTKSICEPLSSTCILSPHRKIRGKNSSTPTSTCFSTFRFYSDKLIQTSSGAHGTVGPASSLYNEITL